MKHKAKSKNLRKSKVDSQKAGGFIVTIDGPSGAGKSTVSRLLADRLHGKLLDTGAMYRSVAYYALKEGAATKSDFGQIAKRLKFTEGRRSGSILVNGENLGKKLRTEKVSAMASWVSKYKEVRDVLTKKQRELGILWAKQWPVIVEGRDIGTVVFPGSQNVHKFFVTANAKERARRRQSELRKMGDKKVTVSAVLLKQAHRDRQDSTRKLAPLTKAKNTIVVNTSGRTAGEAVDFILARLSRERG
ncbi:MAG: (d)CMP kinase [Bdellovibrionales bacterium]|nr:(d)CMP kinase [Bdellovibrionales bacterium]